jgi:hypothetical protein
MRAFARFKESNHGLQPSCDTGDAGVAFSTEIGERNGSCSYVLHVPFMYLVLCLLELSNSCCCCFEKSVSRELNQTSSWNRNF